MSEPVLNPSGKYVKTFLQQYGSGFPLVSMETETDVELPSGGDVAYQSDWSKGSFMRRRKNGNPSDFTFNLMTRMRLVKIKLFDLAKLASKRTVLSNFYTFAQVSDGDPTTFKRAVVMVQGAPNMPTGDSPVQADTTGIEVGPMETYATTAGAREDLFQLVMNQSGVTTVNAAINHVLSINDEEPEFLMVGDPVAPATTPRLYYYKREADGTTTFKTLVLNTITNGIAEEVAVYGDRVLIACSGTTDGIWAASLATIRAAASGANLSATQVSASVVTNAVGCIKRIGNFVFAGSTSGTVYYSGDGGYSFSLLGTLSGTPTVNCIAGSSDKDVWFGGSSGAIGNWYLQKSFTTITPSVITGDDVTAIAVPPRETIIGGQVFRWLYIGTSTGEMWYSKDGGTNWTRSYFKDDGSGSVSDLKFTGTNGLILSILHTTASPASRLLTDLSGGAGGFTVREINAVSAFSNAGMNSVAWFGDDPNFALVVGEPISSLGFVGEVVG